MNLDQTPIIKPTDNTTYWAAAPIKDLATTVLGAVNTNYSDVTNRGLWRVWRQMFRAYYGLSEFGNDHESSLVSFLGEQGELVYIRVNDLRRLVRRVVTMATTNRPGANPRAINNDFDSLKQVPVTRNVIEYIMRHQHVDHTSALALEASMIFGAAYMWVHWDFNAGKEIGKVPIVHEADVMGEDGVPSALAGSETGETRSEYEGDIRIGYTTPLDVIVPPCDDPNDFPWCVVRQFKNRWDLIALFPDHRDALINVQRRDEDMGFSFINEVSDPDMIPVFHFYHRSSPALPGGRYALVVNGEVQLDDGPLPYDDIPIYRVAPGEIIGTGLGYSDAWDVMPLCEAKNATLSTALTTMDAFGIPNVAVESGTDVTTAALAGGMNRFDYPAGGKPPTIMQLQGLDAGTFPLIEYLGGAAEAQLNMNSSALGDPKSNVKSGAMAALLKSEAVEANSGLQNSYYRLLEKLYTAIVRVLKRYAKTERVMAVAGKDNEDGIASFSSETVNMIDRVYVDVGSSMLRSNEGRWALAEMAYGSGEWKIADVIEMLDTGTVEAKFARTNGQKAIIKKENEILSGRPKVTDVPAQTDPATGKVTPQRTQIDGVQTMITDDHPQHIAGHSCVLDSAVARGDGEVVNAVMAHIYDHFTQMETMDPRLAAILGIQMMPAPDQIEQRPDGGNGGQQSPQRPNQKTQAPGANGEPAAPAQRAEPATPPAQAPGGSA